MWRLLSKCCSVTGKDEWRTRLSLWTKTFPTHGVGNRRHCPSGRQSVTHCVTDCPSHVAKQSEKWKGELSVSDRYSAHGPEAESEPGSRGRVLINRLGIVSAREMAHRESESLLAATQRMIDETQLEQRFSADDIRHMHRVWLGEIYPWAGEYRHVNMGKENFMFAAATQVPRLMQEFERGPLHEYTPCRFETGDAQARALAVVHAELILIHPFRDGNGRCARLLAMLMGLQAGLPALDFSGIRGERQRQYIAAVHAAVGRDYAPMTEVFRSVIARTLRALARISL